MELDDHIYKQILDLSERGDKLMANGDFDNAIKNYSDALDLVPGPKEQWEASTWLHTALGDAYFFKSDFSESLNYLFAAMNGPKSGDNPYIALRIGQNFFELNRINRAEEYLMKAYMLGGEDIFVNEDSKYFEIIKKHL